MDSRHHNAHDKYQRGKKMLSSAAGDPQQLGLALIALHGALEDQIRSMLAERIPDQRDIIWDSRTTQWKDLLAYSRQYLGLSEQDARLILDANHYRQEVAHGNKFTWSQANLEQYADMVGRWCGQMTWMAPPPKPRPRPSPSEQRLARPASRTPADIASWTGRLGPLLAVGCLLAAVAILGWIVLPFVFAPKGPSQMPTATPRQSGALATATTLPKVAPTQAISLAAATTPTAVHPGNCSRSPNSGLAQTKRAFVSDKVSGVLRVRTKPTTNTDIAGLLKAGDRVRIMDGPVCADGYWWWKVEIEAQPNVQGWAAGGDESADWLVPAP